jgi:hypothetical protein
MPVHFLERGCVQSTSRSTFNNSRTLRLGLRPQPRSIFSATRNPGAGKDFTDLAAAVQLRLRVAASAHNQQTAGCMGWFRFAAQAI